MPLPTDISGTDDIDPALSVVDGPRAYGEAILRRLSSPQGSLEDDPRYGYDLRSEIGSLSPISAIEQRVLAQMYDEEGTVEATADVQRLEESLTVQCAAKLDDGSTHRFTVSAEQLTVALLLDDE